MSTLRPYFYDNESYESFMKLFWEWWDKQTPEFRAQYNYHKSDMAELFFYNKEWKHTHSHVI